MNNYEILIKFLQPKGIEPNISDTEAIAYITWSKLWHTISSSLSLAFDLKNERHIFYEEQATHEENVCFILKGVEAECYCLVSKVSLLINIIIYIVLSLDLDKTTFFSHLLDNKLNSFIV